MDKIDKLYNYGSCYLAVIKINKRNKKNILENVNTFVIEM